MWHGISFGDLVIIFSLGGLEFFLWRASHKESQKTNELLQEIADGFYTIDEVVIENTNDEVVVDAANEESAFPN